MYCYSKSGFLIIQNIQKGKLYKLAPGFKVVKTEFNCDGDEILFIASNKDLIFYSNEHDFFFQ
jgi:hypothetical protein